MKKNNSNIEFKLLPNRAKKMGWVIVAISFITFIVFAGFTNDIPRTLEWRVNVFRLIADGIIFGLLIVVFSKEKIEDERVVNLRYKYLAHALLFGCLLFFFSHLTNLIFQTTIGSESGFFILGVSLGYYILNFNAEINKEKQEKNKHEEE